ncbi:hypothetical protein [Streptomyces sp. NPDC000983]|uniref:hypothetical protein n=1 Tax=Streptomyces sp. NPDC000983 TaxID=3154373 RepID=UPI0033318459
MMPNSLLRCHALFAAVSGGERVHCPGSLAARQRSPAFRRWGGLAEFAQARWRAITASHLLALVCSGARTERGVLVEREQLD